MANERTSRHGEDPAERAGRSDGAEELAEAIESLKADIARLSKTVADLVGEQAGAMRDTAAERARRMAQTGRETGERLADTGRDAARQLSDEIAARPITAVLAAAGLGYLFGKISRRH